jgi:hypothetical protein
MGSIRVGTALALVVLVLSGWAEVDLASASISRQSGPPLRVCMDASSCYTSIQAAIGAASDGATIKIAAGTYQGSLDITKDVSLQGAGANATFITADADQRVINISAGSSVTIKGATISGGLLRYIPGVSPDFYPDFVGGGIFNRGSLALYESTVTGNRSFEGAGIYNEGTLTLRGSSISDNLANAFGLPDGYGGGIFNTGTATLTGSNVGNNFGFVAGGVWNNFGGTMSLSDSAISHNGAQDIGGIVNGGTLTISGSDVSENVGIDGGGGISNFGSLTMSDSTVRNNRSIGPFGPGGISNAGTMTLRESSVSGNDTEGGGGGIWNRGTVTLYGTTVSGNTASSGGGILNVGNAKLYGTTVSGNTASCTGGGIYNTAILALFESQITNNVPNDRIDADPTSPPSCV